MAKGTTPAAALNGTGAANVSVLVWSGKPGLGGECQDRSRRRM